MKILCHITLMAPNIITQKLTLLFLFTKVTTHPLELPARFIVSTIMQKFASIAIRAKACFFVVFAQIRLVVNSDRGPDILCTSKRTMCSSCLLLGNGFFSSHTLCIWHIVVREEKSQIGCLIFQSMITFLTYFLVKWQIAPVLIPYITLIALWICRVRKLRFAVQLNFIIC